jgi:hypothetical protein
MVLAAQVASRVFTFLAMVLALVAVASPFWAQISNSSTSSASGITTIDVASRGLYWPWSFTVRNSSGVYYETAAQSGDCDTERSVYDFMIAFNYMQPFCNGKGVDGALWVSAFFGTMTVVLGVVSLVLDVQRSGTNLHLGSVGALLVSSILTFSLYMASSAFQNAGLRNCANAYLFAGRTFGSQAVWNAVCEDHVTGWSVASNVPFVGNIKILGTVTGPSFLCELIAAIMAFIALICAYIARLKLRAGGEVQLAVKVDP